MRRAAVFGPLIDLTAYFASIGVGASSGRSQLVGFTAAAAFYYLAQMRARSLRARDAARDLLPAPDRRDPVGFFPAQRSVCAAEERLRLAGAGGDRRRGHRHRGPDTPGIRLLLFIGEMDAGQRCRLAGRGDGRGGLCSSAAADLQRSDRAPSGGNVLLELRASSRLRLSRSPADGRVADRRRDRRVRRYAVRRAQRRAVLRRDHRVLRVPADAQPLRRGERAGGGRAGAGAAVLLSGRNAHDPRCAAHRGLGGRAVFPGARPDRRAPRSVVAGGPVPGSRTAVEVHDRLARTVGIRVHAARCARAARGSGARNRTARRCSRWRCFRR